MDTEATESDNFTWAIAARARSQRLLLALYHFGVNKESSLADSPEARVFGFLVGVAFYFGERRSLQTCRLAHGPKP